MIRKKLLPHRRAFLLAVVKIIGINLNIIMKIWTIQGFQKAPVSFKLTAQINSKKYGN